MNITCKNYGFEKGLSSRLFDEQLNKEKFLIKGPMGKGLGLTNQSKGDFVAFAAGTGVLVFVDLVARLAMRDLGIVSEDTFDKDFKLHLFASF